MKAIIETQIFQRDNNSGINGRNYNFVYDYSNLGEFDYRYNMKLRLDAARLGFLAMADMLLFPMIGLLYVTQYRYGVVKRKLEQAGGVGLDEAAEVGKQFWFLCLDFLFFPTCGLLLFLTQYRIIPVMDILKNPSWVERDNLELYFITLRQTFFLIIDVITIPFILILLCSGMRTKDVFNIIMNPRCRVSGLKMNMAILTHLFILIHDVALLFPAVLFSCVIGPHRVMIMVREVQRIFQEERATANRNVDIGNNLARGSNTGHLLSAPSLTTPFISPTTAPMYENDAFLRLSLTEEGGDSAVGQPVQEGDAEACITPLPSPAIEANTDMPPSPPHPPTSHQSAYSAVKSGKMVESGSPTANTNTTPVNAPTVQPTPPLQPLDSIDDLDFPYPETRFAVWTHFINTFQSDQNDMDTLSFIRTHDLYIRRVVWKQFCFLLVDLFVCLPFVCIIATLYRLPTILFQLVNKLVSKPLEREREFDVISGTVVWNTVEAPKMSVQVYVSPINVARREVFERRERMLRRIQTSSLSHAKLVVISEPLWDQLESALGSFIANIVKSFFPVKLVVGETVKIEEVVIPSKDAAQPAPAEGEIKVDGIVDESPASSNKIITITLPPLQGVKARTMLKRLRKFNGDTKLILQVEADVAAADRGEGTAATGEAGESDSGARVLFRWQLTILDLIHALETCERTEGGRGEFDPTSPSIINIPRLEFEGGDEGEGNGARGSLKKAPYVSFVEEFYLIILKEFYQLILDISYLCMYICVCVLSPWRAVYLTYWLLFCGPSDDNVFLMENILHKLHVAEHYLHEFRASFMHHLFGFVKTNIFTNTTMSMYLYGYGRDYSIDSLVSSFKSMDYFVDVCKIASSSDYKQYKRVLRACEANIMHLEDSHKGFKVDTDARMSSHSQLLFAYMQKSLIPMILHRYPNESYDIRTGMYIRGWTADSRILKEKEDSEFLEKHYVKVGLFSAVLEDSYLKKVREFSALKLKMKEAFEKAKKEKAESRRTRYGLSSRSNENTRYLIFRQFRLCFQDILAVCMLVVIVLTGFRLLPLVKDVYASVAKVDQD
eukprot:gene25245-30486_t